MVAKMQNKDFIVSSENSLVSLSFQEVATGRGEVILDSFATANGGYSTFYLGNIPNGSTIRADPQYQISNAFGGGADPTLSNTINFDNSPSSWATVINGEAYVQASFFISAGNASTSDGYLIFKIKKVVDGVETTIGTSDATQTITVAGPGYSSPYSRTMKMTCARTTIPAGATLRLSIEFWGKNAANSGNLYVCCDPANRNITTPTTVTATTNPTYLKWFIPFEVEK